MAFWTVSIGKQEMGNNGVNKPWRGYCYGSWLPRVRWNGGRPWRRECLDIGWYWLCYHGSFTRWQGTNHRTSTRNER
jgi:hypothetical protein